MFRAAAVVALLAVGCMAWWLQSGGEDAAPPSTDRAAPAHGSQPDAPPSTAEGAAAGARASQEPSGESSPGLARELRNTVFGTVELRAALRPDGSNEEVPLESFRWKATGMAIGIEPNGISEGRVARIRVPVDVEAAVVVESDGCRPSLPVDIALRGSQFRAVTVQMRPQFEKSRITLRCKDEFGAPVDRISVRCEFHSENAESRREWSALWTSAVEARNGVHVLESPVSGWCRFHVTPIDKDGLARGLLPAQIEVKVSDDRRVDADVTHALGGTLLATWDDGVKKPKGLSGARLHLFDAQGKPRGVNWNKGPAPGTDSQFDSWAVIDYWTLPCYAAEALPEGRYSLQLQGEDLDVTKHVEIRKGQEARVVFP